MKVQSLEKNYLLDQLSLTSNKSRFTFPLKPNVLKQAGVLPNTLRALAEVNFNSHSVYLPVTIGQSSGQYEFVFYSS
ncbi:MAG: hypothetical protein ACIWVG_06170 [Gloeotrichia echinulata HAB0833]